jgi:subtilase family serine protease
MRKRKVFSGLAVVVLIVTSASLAVGANRKGTLASPMLKVGPEATAANTAGTSYGVFTCQVGLSPYTCYDPYQIRHAYNIDTLTNAGFDGKGKTIVIIDAFQAPNLLPDLNYFNNFYGLPSLNGLGSPADSNLGTFTQIAPDGLGPVDTNWDAEITLDVLWSHAIAPRANIMLVLAKSSADADILSATKYAVDNNLGDVISQSFGEDESCMDPDLLAEQHQVFANATAKNVTIFASAGDDGAGQANCNGSALVKAVSTPADDPLVTSVGGTELHAAGYCFTVRGCDPNQNPTPGTYQGEIVWNEEATGFGATGGGFSLLFDEPSYEEGTIHGGKRLGGPDVSYNAAVLHGVLVRFNGTWYLFGGTSAGSPQWAAITAIADQYAGSNLGFINEALFHIGQARKHYAASFFDITSGNNSVPSAEIDGYIAGQGWDPDTGLGSPRAGGLVDMLIQFVSPGDGISAIAGSMPHPQGTPSTPGHLKPH